MKNERINNIPIAGAQGRPMLADLTYKPDGKVKPIVIFCHGFKGFKDWGAFNAAAEYFANQNFVFIKFNFSHNGTTAQQPADFADLNAFAENNFSHELEDLDNIISWALSTPLLPLEQADHENIYLIGHSRGGGTAIIKAAEDARIKKIATWASIKDYAYAWDEDTVQAWREKKVMEIANSRTGQVMHLNYQLYEDLEKHRGRLDILAAAADMKIPMLVIHGTQDEAVPLEHALALKRTNATIKLDLIPESGHTFGVAHPFTDTVLPFEYKIVLEHTAEFFRNA